MGSTPHELFLTALFNMLDTVFCYKGRHLAGVRNELSLCKPDVRPREVIHSYIPRSEVSFPMAIHLKKYIISAFNVSCPFVSNTMSQPLLLEGFSKDAPSAPSIKLRYADVRAYPSP
jgi:hypothetical protein